MWTLVWTVLGLSIVVVPVALFIWVIRQAYLALGRVSRALSALSSDMPQAKFDSNLAFFPGAAMSTGRRAKVMCRRKALRRGRVRARVARSNLALQRWGRIGFLDTAYGQVDVRLQVRGRGED